MKLRQLIGLVATGASLLFVAACGDDNDTFVPPTPVPTSTPVPPTNTKTITPTPPTGDDTPTPTKTMIGGCGDRAVQTGETCDDGNTDGGDGCAANCTTERPVSCVFGGATGALVQTGVFALPLTFTGAQTLTAGNPRDTEVGAFKPGDIPVVIKQEDLNFDPVQVPGLVCACVRAVAAPETLGPGNAGAGTVGCGPQGLEGVNVLSTIDHNTNDIDPTCANGTPDTMNPTVCNGKLIIETSGTGPQGSAVIATSTSITTISDGGSCAMQCLVLAGVMVNGPDCIPCTEDDPNQVPASSVTTTTEMASAKLFDLNNQAGKEIDCDQQCGGSTCSCMTEGVRVSDCELLKTDPDAAIAGVKLVGAFGQINAPQTGDIVVTTFFECAQ